ncbi:sugar transferase, partial [Cylindrospermopsis raciborskii]|uniref:sugar transferase n=1 Tax=Cylindrospermopsis raciborskii TaxID=77022 RepID=UPI0022C6CD8B
MTQIFTENHTKNFLDWFVAILLLTLTSPLLLVITILVRIKLGTPVLFSQQRPGLKGRPFTILKFRTMIDKRDAHGNLLPDSARLTPFGRWLRSTSLDELPELINVIRGEMSFVGPRPLLMKYLNLYTPEQMRRHNMKPGITGWAQVNGRNALEWEEKFKLDLWYIDHWSLMLDLRILFITVVKVIKRQGISNGNHATMIEFKGTKIELGASSIKDFD